MVKLIHGRIFIAQEISNHLKFYKKLSNNAKFTQNTSNLHKISPDIMDNFENLSLKSKYPFNIGSLNRGCLT